MFSKETYMARRAKLKQTIGSGLLLFLGNDESGMNYADNTYHFRQDSTFLYFFGCIRRGYPLSSISITIRRSSLAMS